MRYFIVVCALIVALGCGCKKKPEPETGNPNVMLGGPGAAPKDEPIPPPPPDVPGKSRIPAVKLGVDYLLTRQSADGGWRSDVYATFRDGTALTPLVVNALLEASDAGVRSVTLEAAIKRGCDYLARFVKDGTVVPPGDFEYPVYTAALALKAFCHPNTEEYAKHRAAWVKYLKERQLTEKLGWKPEEKQYGGWGYCRVIPQKPEPNKFAPPLIESNLSATVFALDALKAADALDADTAKAAAIFVRTCQNWQRPPPGVPPPWFKYLDGGFHFIYDDPTRNKAGMVPKAAADWPQLFFSYGSTTADGLQALALCNDPADKDRRDAARKWLAENFRAEHHPGIYLQARESNRDAEYFYYAASVARVMRDQKLQLANNKDWSSELSRELGRRQLKDGNWSNYLDLVRENDPIVATSSTLLALARCK